MLLQRQACSSATCQHSHPIGEGGSGNLEIWFCVFTFSKPMLKLKHRREASRRRRHHNVVVIPYCHKFIVNITDPITTYHSAYHIYY